jgi:hypothetical protein
MSFVIQGFWRKYDRSSIGAYSAKQIEKTSRRGKMDQGITDRSVEEPPMTDSEHHLAPPIPTNWHVITGAPCSGKTAVIEALARQGYRIVPEIARSYIESRLACGATLNAIKADALAFESHILLGKIAHRRRAARGSTLCSWTGPSPTASPILN